MKPTTLIVLTTIFPALFLGIFSKRLNKEGAIAGMLAGLIFTASYIIYFKFLFSELDSSSYWLLGISPEGIGFLGMIINFLTALVISSVSSKPPIEVGKMVDKIRLP